MNRSDLVPHAYYCACEDCKAMTAAITARNADGSYFYTDQELEVLASARRMARNPRRVDRRSNGH